MTHYRTTQIQHLPTLDQYARHLFLEVLFLSGGTLAGLFVLGIFTRRANGVGAVAGAGASAAAVLAAKFLTEMQPFLYVAVGLGVCVGAGYLVSVVVPAGRRDISSLTIHTMPRQDGASAQ